MILTHIGQLKLIFKFSTGSKNIIHLLCFVKLLCGPKNMVKMPIT